MSIVFFSGEEKFVIRFIIHQKEQLETYFLNYIYIF